MCFYKMLLRWCFLSCAFMLVVCKRKSRLFSFNYLENRDISVDLDFNIPFITIPIKKTVDSLGGSSEFPAININPAALALGGAVVLGTTVLLPLVIKNYANYNTDYRYSRILDNTEFGMDAVLNFANQLLGEGQTLRGCTLRVACWSAKRHSGDTHRIINFMSNNKIISTFINTTVIEDAMLSGRHGRDCMTYAPCPLQEQYIPILMDNLAVLTIYG